MEYAIRLKGLTKSFQKILLSLAVWLYNKILIGL